MERKSVNEFMEYSEEKFTKRIMYKEGETTAFVLNFMPNQALPVHKHPNTEVYLYVVTGTGTLIIDGAESSVTTGDVIHVDSQEEMSFKNNGDEPVSLYVILSKVPSELYAKDI